MPAVLRLRHRPAEGLCASTVRRLPDATVVLRGRSPSPGVVDGDRVLLLVRGPDRERLADALEGDGSVAAWHAGSFSHGLACSVEPAPDWQPSVAWATGRRRPIVEVFDDGWWYRTIRVDSRATADELAGQLETENVVYEDIEVFEPVGDPPDGQLTGPQREALAVAHEVGYFEIPRENGLAAVADELDISRQAVAERLRRGYRTLVEANLEAERANDGT